MIEALLMFPAMWAAFALWSIAAKIGRIEELLADLAERDYPDEVKND